MQNERRNYAEYRTIDKSAWPRRGEWDDEPDKAQWIDETTGLDCLIVRNGVGALCGYVGVPEGHPMYRKHYDEVDVRAHGGLTFSDMCADASAESFERWRQRMLTTVKAEAENYPHGDAARAWRESGRFIDDYAGWLAFNESRRICHKPEAGRPDHVWWLGFDCAHSGDICPSYERGTSYEDSYKDFRYVTNEVTELAAQLAALAQ